MAARGILNVVFWIVYSVLACGTRNSVPSFFLFSDVKNHPDKKSILMYLTTLFEAMSADQKQVFLEEVSESSENELQVFISFHFISIV